MNNNPCGTRPISIVISFFVVNVKAASYAVIHSFIPSSCTEDSSFHMPKNLPSPLSHR